MRHDTDPAPRKPDAPPLRNLFLDAGLAIPAMALLLASFPAIAAQQGSPKASAPAPASATALPHGAIEPLWPSGAPGAIGDTEEDKPHLEIFGATSPGLRTAVIVCPGGGYLHLAYEKEGIRIAEWLNVRGITAFILTYRLAPRYGYPAPFLDGYRAVRWVRSHAQQYSVDPDKIGMWGFSAGAHLVGMVGTHFDAGNPAAGDPIDRVSDRPDFVVSSYGPLTKAPGASKPGFMKVLLGDHPTPAQLDDIAPDTHVTTQTPPFFLYATTTDKAVPVLSSVVFYTALVRAGIPAEMHIFEQGPHGSGLGQDYSTLSAWPGLLENWLRLHGWLGEKIPAQSPR